MQTRNYILLAAAALLTAPMLPAAPIAGGLCGQESGGAWFFEGTLADVASSEGCFMAPWIRIYDVKTSLPEGTDLTQFHFGGTANSTKASASLGVGYPAGTDLTFSIETNGPAVIDAWWTSSDFIVHSETHFDGTITKTRRAVSMWTALGFLVDRDATLVPSPDVATPEPSAFLPLLGIGLLWIISGRTRLYARWSA